MYKFPTHFPSPHILTSESPYHPLFKLVHYSIIIYCIFYLRFFCFVLYIHLKCSTQSRKSSWPPPTRQQTEVDPMTFVLQMQQQQLALQEHMICLLARLLPDEQNAPTPSRNQRVKPECLVIESDTSDNKWIIFRDAWSCYKEMTQLTDSTEAQNELRSAFSSSVNIMLEYVKSVHPEVFSNFSQWSRAMEKPSRCLYPDWSHKRCSVPLKDNVVVITSTAQPHSLRTWLNPKSLSAYGTPPTRIRFWWKSTLCQPWMTWSDAC